MTTRDAIGYARRLSAVLPGEVRAAYAGIGRIQLAVALRDRTGAVHSQGDKIGVTEDTTADDIWRETFRLWTLVAQSVFQATNPRPDPRLAGSYGIDVVVEPQPRRIISL